ncbi:MAG: signal peptide peptidase SppA, partial [Myxococcota bacterium]
LIALGVLFIWPWRRRARHRALAKTGWLELRLTGDVVELPPSVDVAQAFVRRLLKRKDPPRVVLLRLRKLVDELISDSYAKGVLVRIGPLKGGWAAASSVFTELQRLREAGRQIVVHLEGGANNRQAMVAAAGTRVLMTPAATMSATGVASSGLFLREALEHFGLKVEATSHGRYKSAPDQFTRTDRSEADVEQTKAILDQMDNALIDSLMTGRVLNRADAEALIDAAPMVGTHAVQAGFCDELARDEDLPKVLRSLNDGQAPEPMGASVYLRRRKLPKLWPVRQRQIGVVRVHGTILDERAQIPLPDQQGAIAEAVVDDLRTALTDDQIGAVVLHVDSRGGSVTASDVIYAAVDRLNQDKPVIACFGDVATSGGYYVACGARAIVASPLTLTGSIGVFGLIPTWAKLTERLSIGHDTLKNRKNAAMYDPWAGLDEQTRAHAQKEVDAMYDTFVGLVAKARGLSTEEVDAVAQGRVWTGQDARQRRLVDDLGGFTAAVDLAKTEAGGIFADDPVIVSAKGPQSRPGQHDPESTAKARRWFESTLLDGDDRFGLQTPLAVQQASDWLRMLTASGAFRHHGAVACELLALAASTEPRTFVAYAPITSPR